MRRFAVVFFAVYLWAAVMPGFALAFTLPDIYISSRAAILVDMGAEQELYHRNADGAENRIPPAGLTKIMTALLAFEFAASGEGSLDGQVVVTEKAFGGLPDSAVDLQPGETITLRSLLYCMLVALDNRSCNIIAEHVAGSSAAFVELMNRRAAELGCLDTHFTNAHGLHNSNHYTTAGDIYRIAKEALAYPEFMTICDTRNTMSVSATGSDGQTQVTHLLTVKNDMIAIRSSHNPYRYPEARGIIAGYTAEAGYCVVSTAERDGRLLLCVVMGAKDNPEIRSYVEAKDLFEWGFKNFTMMTLLVVTEQLGSVKVFEGKDNDEVTLVPKAKLEALVPKTLNVQDDVEKTVKMSQVSVYAPVEKGTVLGEVVVSYGDRVFDPIPLVASIKIDRDETEHMIASCQEYLSQEWFLYALAGLAMAVLLYITFVIIYNRRRRKRGNTRQNYRGKRRRR
ncbi:MAG: D-alanyl-D-alanine carboxypeptidase [Oscillospiraceae bacterium]|nr:D-alanyl-D-alanine carboxypeptidase [Oscillospiraceae bacterium]